MSIFDRAKTVGLFEGAAGADRVLFNIKSDPKIIGDELVTNGTFDTDSDWTKTGEATISGGTGNIVDTDGTSGSQLGQSGVMTVGKHYRIAFNATVNSNASSWAIKIQDGASDANIGRLDSSGFYVFYHTAESTYLYFRRHSVDSGVDVSIDNVSVKEVDQLNADFKFSRGSNLTATRVNKDGYIEKGRENLFTQSNEFDGDDWDPQNVTVISGQSGYDGSSNAFKLTVEVGESGANVGQDFTQTGVKTFSVYAKGSIEDGTTGVRFFGKESGGSNNVSVFFVLTGDGSIHGTPNNVIDTNIEKIGSSDWYRCSVTFDKTLSKAYIYVSNGAGGNFTDDTDAADTSGTGSILIQNAQIEAGLVATDYIESKSTTGKAGILEDEPRFDYTGGGCPKLLMEMGSVNKQTHSEYLDSWGTLNLSLTTNAAKSPEGVNNASKIVESTDTGIHRLDKQWTFVDGTIYSLSFFAKAAGRNKIEVKYGTNTVANFHATFTLDGTDPVNIGDGTASMQSMGDGWYRCKIENIEGHRLDTGNIHPESVSTGFNFLLHDDSSPTTNNYEGDGSSGVLIYGFQQEEKPFATSYIPTYGAQGTRAMDNNIDDAIPANSYDLNKSWSLFVDLGETKKDKSFGSQSFIDLETNDSTKKVGLFVNDNETSSGLNLYLGTANPPNNGYVFGSSPNDALDAETSSVCASYDHTNYRLTYYINGDLYGYQATELNMGDSDSGGGRFRVNTAFLMNVKKYLFFEEALSDTEAAILTGTSYNSFGAMTDALTNYTTYE